MFKNKNNILIQNQRDEVKVCNNKKENYVC